MFIALLALLGVDLWVIVVLLAAVLIRRRWVSRQPGAFTGAIRVTHGDVPGLRAKWKRGHGRWVRDVLVWTMAPLLLRNKLVPVSGLAGEVRAIADGKVRRIGKHPTCVLLMIDGGARIEVASSGNGRELAAGPFAGTAKATGRHAQSDPQNPVAGSAKS